MEESKWPGAEQRWGPDPPGHRLPHRSQEKHPGGPVPNPCVSPLEDQLARLQHPHRGGRGHPKCPADTWPHARAPLKAVWSRRGWNSPRQAALWGSWQGGEKPAVQLGRAGQGTAARPRPTPPSLGPGVMPGVGGRARPAQDRMQPAPGELQQSQALGQQLWRWRNWALRAGLGAALALGGTREGSGKERGASCL